MDKYIIWATTCRSPKTDHPPRKQDRHDRREVIVSNVPGATSVRRSFFSDMQISQASQNDTILLGACIGECVCTAVLSIQEKQMSFVDMRTIVGNSKTTVVRGSLTSADMYVVSAQSVYKVSLPFQIEMYR